MKDALGHGSDTRGGSTADRLDAVRKAQGYKPLSASARGLNDFLDYREGKGPMPSAMAAVLSGGHPKSAPVGTHPSMAGVDVRRMNNYQASRYHMGAMSLREQKRFILKPPKDKP